MRHVAPLVLVLLGCQAAGAQTPSAASPDHDAVLALVDQFMHAVSTNDYGGDEGARARGHAEHGGRAGTGWRHTHHAASIRSRRAAGRPAACAARTLLGSHRVAARQHCRRVGTIRFWREGKTTHCGIDVFESGETGQLSGGSLTSGARLSRKRARSYDPRTLRQGAARALSSRRPEYSGHVRTMLRAIVTMASLALVACDDTPASPTPSANKRPHGADRVSRIEHAAIGFARLRRGCVSGVGATHIHPSWRSFAGIPLQPVLRRTRSRSATCRSAHGSRSGSRPEVL